MSFLHLGVVAKPQPARALFIGLGGGSAPMKFLHDYPSLQAVDAVEIDPEVVKVAGTIFALPEDPRLRSSPRMAGYLSSTPGGRLRGGGESLRSGGDRCLFVQYDSVPPYYFGIFTVGPENTGPRRGWLFPILSGH